MIEIPAFAGMTEWEGVMEAIAGKRVVLGVSGSIACYKAADIASKLMQAGTLVDVVLTRAAQEFVTPLTFRSLTHRPVITDIFDAQSADPLEHVEIAHRADAVVIAPATAHVMAKLAHGLADDALSTIILATEAPVLIAPAMEHHMWTNAATQGNVATLRERGFTFAGPDAGRLASGAVGSGRLVETADILDALNGLLSKDQDLLGRHIVVSAGGTQEPIDPVRVVTNRSSGKQGYAFAEAARDRGARVTLVTAAGLANPAGVNVVKVESARQMLGAVSDALNDAADALVMAAAVADWEPVAAAGQKMKKVEGQDILTIDMKKTPDILAQVSGLPGVKVGFAAETEDLLANARAKLEGKKLDMIVANDVSATDAGFAVDTNRVVILDKSGGQEELPLMSKRDVADAVLDRVCALLSG